jgi:hypothetical protein
MKIKAVLGIIGKFLKPEISLHLMQKVDDQAIALPGLFNENLMAAMGNHAQLRAGNALCQNF